MTEAVTEPVTEAVTETVIKPSSSREAGGGSSALTFRLSARMDAAKPADPTATCVYHQVAHELALRLFETQLQGALDGGLVPTVSEAALTHHIPGGRFDRAEGTLKLSNLGPSRFLLLTSFYLGDKLVTTAVQHGVLDFEELSPGSSAPR